MESIIKRVRDKLIFTFSDGSTYKLQNSLDSTQSVDNYITSCSLKESILNSGSNNIIGSVGSNNLSATIISRDGLLVPDNSSSPYYRMMNESCVIDLYVYCTELESTSAEYEVYFGKYYVLSWEVGQSHNTNHEVTITATNIIGKIKDIAIKRILLKRDTNFKDYLVYVIDKLNSSMDYTLYYDQNSFDVIEGEIVSWLVNYKNITSTEFSKITDDIINNTLALLYCNRNSIFKADSLLDEDVSQAVGTLNGGINLFSYNRVQGNLSNYSGFNLEYILNNYIESVSLGSSNKYTPVKGSNTVTIDCNYDDIVAVDSVRIKATDDSNRQLNYDIENVVYYKGGIEVTFTTNIVIPLDIEVFGRINKYNYKTDTVYIDNSIKNSLIDLKNYVLNTSGIREYELKLKDIMTLQNNLIQVEGYINPNIKPGDIVSVIGTSLSINGYYKVVQTDYKLVTNYRCKMVLLKIGSFTPTADQLLENNMTLLERSLNGGEVEVSNVNSLSTEYENIVLNTYRSDFESLETCLNRTD